MSQQRPALVICAHGSRVEGWADAVEEFARHVAESPGVADAFSIVETAYLEHTQPRLPDAVRMALSSGCSEVYVVPLFLTVSNHASEDVPGLLGLNVPAHVRKRLIAEGQAPLSAGLPVKLLDLGDVHAIMLKNVLRRTELATQERKREAIVLCAYGSTLHHEQWETLLRKLRSALMHAGYGYANHAYVGHTVGMSPQPTATAILDAGRMAGIRRVHVIPLLMSVSNLQTQTIEAATRDASRRVRHPVVYTADAILPDGDLAAHVGSLTLKALGVFPAIGPGGEA